MHVTIAKHAGFCWGVRRAVENALRTAETAPAEVFTDGPLIHNSHMARRLKAARVAESGAPETLPRGATLIIRAHGISPARRAMLEALPIALVDCTCPDVARIQKTIDAHAADGFRVIILGDADHAEVVGLLGHAHGRGHVVESPADVDALPEFPAGEKICLVSQSTQSHELFAAVTASVLARWPGAEIVKTICNATTNRQSELVAMADACDAFVVAGSPASANTQRLAQIAGALRPTFVVDSADELRAHDFANFTRVVLTAGASTPDFVIEQVAKKLESF